MERRDFLKIVGFASFAGSVGGFSGFLTACQSAPKNTTQYLAPQFTDDLILPPGLTYKKYLSWGDPISAKEFYGNCNDYIAISKIPGTKQDYFFWINHEYPIPFLTHGVPKGEKKSVEHILLEQKTVGGSLLHFKKIGSNWEFQKNSQHNKRWDANTVIPFEWDEKIYGSSHAVGTFANCSGGKTPWNTFLTCEENVEDYYGEVSFENGKRIHHTKSDYNWAEYFTNPPEHYGWVVEINPLTKKSHKLINLGRFAHESATVTQAADSRCVVYMGDDKNNEFIYKFIADKPGTLAKGTLYVANTNKGIWEPLTVENPKLKNKFLNQTELLIQTREAARFAGATPQDRPEDIEVLKDGTVLVALTNNYPRANNHGSIFAIEEKNNNPLSLEFKSYTWLKCGPESGMSCPDNFTLDKNGNLWVTSDISGTKMGIGTHKSYGHNGLFFIPTQGKDKGVVYQVASAPADAEFTGPAFTDDFKNLFLCVQHPGELSGPNGLTSNWPSKKPGAKPLSTLVSIEGPLLEELMKT